MGIHVYGLTVELLADASRAARAVDDAVTLFDDLARIVVLVDQRGRVVVRPAGSAGRTTDLTIPARSGGDAGRGEPAAWGNGRAT
jgi:hypothetical protein